VPYDCGCIDGIAAYSGVVAIATGLARTRLTPAIPGARVLGAVALRAVVPGTVVLGTVVLGTVVLGTVAVRTARPTAMTACWRCHGYRR
jgi:hypothetical protein